MFDREALFRPKVLSSLRVKVTKIVGIDISEKADFYVEIEHFLIWKDVGIGAV